jgi:hemerythrin-like metal-binding protein
MHAMLELHAEETPAIDVQRLRDCLYAALADSGALALAALEGTRLLYASAGFLRRLDIPSLDGEQARFWRQHIHPADRDRVSRTLVEAQARGVSCHVECRLLGADGASSPVRLAGCPAGPAAPHIYALLLHDDGAGRFGAAPPRLPAPVQRAFSRRRDGVLERASDLLVDAWLRAASLAVLAVGLRCPTMHLSAQVMAEAQAQVLARLRRGLRHGDAIGAHGEPGQSCLLVAIPDLSGPFAAAIVAGRLIETALAPLQLDGQRIELEAHVGIALFPHDDTELSGLLAHARAALELARQSGPDRYSLAESSLNGALRARAMPWDARWNLGVPDIDSQHLRLVADLDEISRHAGVGADAASLRARVDRLQRNLQADFYVEEAVMSAQNFPGGPAHRLQHEQVLRNFSLLTRADPRQGTALLARYLYEWLPGHIRDFDAPLLAQLPYV